MQKFSISPTTTRQLPDQFKMAVSTASKARNSGIELILQKSHEGNRGIGFLHNELPKSYHEFVDHNTN